MTIVRKHKRKLKRGYTKVKSHKRKVRKKWGGEIFNLMFDKYDIEKAEKIAKNKDIEYIEPVSPPRIRLNKEHIDNVDIKKPVIYATRDFGGEKVSFLVDGHHRIAKAKKLGIKIPAHFLDDKETLKIWGYNPAKRKLLEDMGVKIKPTRRPLDTTTIGEVQGAFRETFK